MADGAGPGRRYKVERLVEEYGLEGLGEELERRWTADAGDRDSLRDLAELVNHRVLRERLERAGATPLDGEVENLYRLLVGADVSEGVRTEAERRLEREDIDVERVLGRAAAVAEDRLERLRNADRITLGEFRTAGSVRVTCRDCEAHLDVADLLERGGCDCRPRS